MDNRVFRLSDETAEMIKAEFIKRKEIYGKTYKYEDMFADFANYLTTGDTKFYNMEKLQEEFINKIKQL